MTTITVKVHYESKLLRVFFPKWVAGVTVGTHIFFRDAAEKITPRLLNHELIHVCQYAEKGVLTFLWEYLWKQRKVAYRAKPTEIEAYANEADPGYISKRWAGYRVVCSEGWPQDPFIVRVSTTW